MNKKTKIVATISEQRCEADFIKELYDAGMDVARLNTAHQTHERTTEVIDSIRSVSDRIAILIDTKGPEIRTTESDKDISMVTGQKVLIKGGLENKTSEECIYCSHDEIVRDVPVGTTFLIDDGDVEVHIVDKKGDALIGEVMNDGVLGSKKSINIPNVHISLPALNKKDRGYIQYAIDNDVDFVAHSFVRNKEDLLEIQQILDANNSDLKIIAKIENQEGVENIDEIIDHCYGIMVARGDLAIELPAQQIPVVQKTIINKCIKKRKPVITATQMLHSMIKKPRPTRAEVSDVANAIYDGTDAIMLSGETTYGDYPMESVKMMADIAIEIEAAKPVVAPETETVVINNETSAFLAKSAVRASVVLDTKAIVTDSRTGRTALALAAYRGTQVIYAQCYAKQLVRELALSYGVYANYMYNKKTVHEFLQSSLKALLKKNYFEKDDTVVVVAGNFDIDHGATFMEINKVGDILARKLEDQAH